MRLVENTIETLAPLIKSKELSPVELVKDCLERINETEPALNAYITVLEDQAMLAAYKAEKEIMNGQYRGHLHGIPYSAKDLFTTKGVLTSAGSKVLSDYVPDEDAAVIEKLTEAGAVLVGKTNLHEFAYGGTNENEYYGPARNYWNTEMIPGGSSGGSGTSVAASSSIFSLGTDTGGSIRMPASLCGVVGIKATYGRVSRRGVLPLSSSLDHAGPLAKSTWDVAAVLSVIAGEDKKDLTSSKLDVPDYIETLNQGDEGLKGLTIGICERYYFENIDPEVEQAVRASIPVFEALGAHIIEVDIPSLSEVTQLQGVITSAEAYSYHAKHLAERAEDYGSNIRGRLLMGHFTPAWAYVQAQRLRKEYQKQWSEIYKNMDILLAPTTAITAFPIHAETITLGGKVVNPRDLGVLGRTSPSNFNGFPALSVPCGFNRQGLPIGLQLQGRPFEEAILLKAAYAYEQAQTFVKTTAS
ncbi:aspartyl-tRNA(Asn)/glutamyl-tRNA(Gln) amidotransferase subunit A [Pullulanibacillus pueri]|uniref:Amidase n=1 Tax=Pullulanibacillus pueri TaxID=1437324 RepID=A0A8J2ZWU7_9BACL|nr:amidase [Pullulanibacillus pueri]MBM7682613.1 aspartyl-tRNA(Asn)/glutamyl-tRNA(Gln) amidotransferase subunit A [Pullulanibacillus pueri]GGH82509.1 amidase [Pullulanibacillus pueri]